MSKVLLPTTMLGVAASILILQPQVTALSSVTVGEIAQQITVRIEGPGPSGSGIIIHKEDNIYYVLTAKHVVKDIHPEEEADVFTYDSQVYYLNTKKIHKFSGVDLAVVEFESARNYTVAKIGNSEEAKRGQKVYVAGFPIPAPEHQGFDLSFLHGHINAIHNQPDPDGYRLVYSNSTRSGMSGGPVLNEEGEVIGVHGRAITERLERTNVPNVHIKIGHNQAIPIKTFLDLAPKAGINVEVALSPRTFPHPTPFPTTIPSPPSQPTPPPLISRATRVNYTQLRDLLAQGRWREADKKTFALMLRAANRPQGSVLNQNHLNSFPCEDLKIIDGLWLDYSQGRFGISIQRQIWEEVSRNAENIQDVYRQFGQRVGWIEYTPSGNPIIIQDDIDYKLSAPPGHLPVFISSYTLEHGWSDWGRYTYRDVTFSRAGYCGI